MNIVVNINVQFSLNKSIIEYPNQGVKPYIIYLNKSPVQFQIVNLILQNQVIEARSKKKIHISNCKKHSATKTQIVKALTVIIKIEKLKTYLNVKQRKENNYNPPKEY